MKLNVLHLFFLSLLLISCSLIQKNSEDPFNSGEEQLENGQIEKSGQEVQLKLLLDSMKLDVRKEVLDNGLTILLVENHHLPIFSYYTFFKIGSRHERQGLTGSTHFLEHMMFKGAKKYGANQFSQIVENFGGDSNAYTNNDSTVYYESLPTNSIETIVDLEADRMLNLLLAPDDFEKEKQVVLEERKMRYENEPRGKIYLESTSFMNQGTPYEESVIGRIDDIKSYKRDDILQYFHDYYAPNNAIIVVAGDIDSDKTLDLIKKYYGSIPYSKKVDELKKEKDNIQLFSQESNRRREGREILLKGPSKNPLFYLSYYGYPIGSKKGNLLSLLSLILSSGESAYLKTKYVNNKNPVAISMGAFHSSLQFSGTFIIYGELGVGTGIKQFKKIWEQERQKICSESINPRTLGKAKNQYFISYFEDLKTNAGLAHFLGLNEMYMGDRYYYEKEIKEIAELEINELTNLCEEFFMGSRPNYFVLWDKN